MFLLYPIPLQDYYLTLSFCTDFFFAQPYIMSSQFFNRNIRTRLTLKLSGEGVAPHPLFFLCDNFLAANIRYFYYKLLLNALAGGGAGNRNQKVFAAVNFVKESDCGKALHPNVFVAAPFQSSFFFKHLIPILQQFFNKI